MKNPDEAIERAARALTELAPPHDLETRIKRRLDAEVLHRAPTPRAGYWLRAAGLTAAAVATLALIVQDPIQMPDAVSSAIQMSPELSKEPGLLGSHSPDLHQAVVVTPGWQSPTPAPTRRAQPPPMPETERAWMARHVSALGAFESIQPEPLSVPPITMTPLMTSPMYGDLAEGRQ